MTTYEAILADTPLEKPEDDRLGHVPFAKNLADALCSLMVDECLVFALYGEWGTGKTTTLNFVLHYIKEKPENKRPIVVRFNPWWFSGRGELLTQFFKEFYVALGKEEKFRDFKKLLADFFKIISEVPEPTGIWRVLKIPTWVLKRSTKDKEAWQIREEIRKHLKNQDRRILVVIDDIDRLPAEEIRSLFRVIKAVADFPKTIYLLAFDKNIVIKALADLQGMPGEAYLEKIVQVPFDLPVSDKVALRKVFLEQLNVIFSETPQELFDQTYWWNVFWDGIDHFLNSMRNVKRLTNALKVTYPPVKGEVNPVDFVAIETIRVFCADIYQLIRNNPDMFSGHSDIHSALAPRVKDIKTFHNKWVEHVPKEVRESIKSLLTRIFPKLEAVFGNTNYGPDWESTWRKQLRICSPDIFPIYFRLAVPEGEISNTEMQSILAIAENSEVFSNKLLEFSQQHRPDGSTRLSAFLERIQDYTEKEIPKEYIPKILLALFDVGDKLLVPEDEGRGLFRWGNDIRIGRIMFQLLKRYESQEERFKILKEVFRTGNAVSMIVKEVAVLGQQHGKYGVQAKPDSECLLSAQHVEELEKIALQKVKQAAADGRLLNAPNLAHILYRWRDWDGDEVVRKWVAQVTASDEGLVNFLTGFLSKGYSQSITDRVARIRYRLDPKSLEPFIDPSEIIDRCRALLKSSPNWLKEKKKIAVKTFINWYTLRSSGKNPENYWEEEEQ